jgi:hypothetical protein
MKHSELLWIQNMARLACGKTAPGNQPTEILTQSFNLFLEELTSTLHAHVTYSLRHHAFAWQRETGCSK